MCLWEGGAFVGTEQLNMRRMCGFAARHPAALERAGQKRGQENSNHHRGRRLSLVFRELETVELGVSKRGISTGCGRSLSLSLSQATQRNKRARDVPRPMGEEALSLAAWDEIRTTQHILAIETWGILC